MADSDPNWMADQLVIYQREKMGIPHSFFRRVGADDDWTIVIRLHALQEAGMNRMITTAPGDDRLSNFVGDLNTEGGKLAIIKALDLLPGDIRNFVRMLSRLRNTLVHDVRNFEFDFRKWIESMNPKVRTNLKQYVTTALGNDPLIHGKPETAASAVVLYPRYILMIATLAIMAQI